MHSLEEGTNGTENRKDLTRTHGKKVRKRGSNGLVLLGHRRTENDMIFTNSHPFINLPPFRKVLKHVNYTCTVIEHKYRKIKTFQYIICLVTSNRHRRVIVVDTTKIVLSLQVSRIKSTRLNPGSGIPEIFKGSTTLGVGSTFCDFIL